MILEVPLTRESLKIYALVFAFFWTFYQELRHYLNHKKISPNINLNLSLFRAQKGQK